MGEEFKKYELYSGGKLHKFTGKELARNTYSHPEGGQKRVILYELYRPTEIYVVVQKLGLGEAVHQVSAPISLATLQSYFPDMAKEIGKPAFLDLDYEAWQKFGEDTGG